MFCIINFILTWGHQNKIMMVLPQIHKFLTLKRIYIKDKGNYPYTIFEKKYFNMVIIVLKKKYALEIDCICGGDAMDLFSIVYFFMGILYIMLAIKLL